MGRDIALSLRSRILNLFATRACTLFTTHTLCYMQNVRVAKMKKGRMCVWQSARGLMYTCINMHVFMYISINTYMYIHIFTHVHIYSKVRGCCVGSLKMILSQAHAQEASCAVTVTHVWCVCAGRSHDSYVMCFCPRLKGLLPLQCHESMRALARCHTHILHRSASLQASYI